MRHVSVAFLFLLSFAFARPGLVAASTLKVVVSYSYIESLVHELAGPRAEVFTLSKGEEDPHFVVPRPSFIGRLRQADLFIINGGSLEIGFVPPLIRQANNPRINPGSAGFLDLSQFVDLIQKPDKVSRAEGDVHPEGNPHYLLDYHNVPKLADAIAGALTRLDAGGQAEYSQRLKAFQAKWSEKTTAWDKAALPFKGALVIQYHRLFDYFVQRMGMTIAGEIESKPGIPPSGRHIEELLTELGGKPIQAVLVDSYHEHRTAQGVADKLHSRLVVAPHDVRAVEGATDIFALFDTLLGRLAHD